MTETCSFQQFHMFGLPHTCLHSIHPFQPSKTMHCVTVLFRHSRGYARRPPAHAASLAPAFLFLTSSSSSTPSSAFPSFFRRRGYSSAVNAAAAPVEAKEGKRIFGKASNNLRIGIVGMPNIGKSLLFNILSEQNVPSENFPFCTIDPNNAVVPVPDERLEFLRDLYQPVQCIPSTLSITDVAGLVAGAAEGKGLGNEFLSHIAAVDAIFHLVRVFPPQEVNNVIHVEGSIDPIRDMEIISQELILKDIQRTEIVHQKATKSKSSSQGGKVPDHVIAAYQKALTHLENNVDVRECFWSEQEFGPINELNLLSSKPIIYLVNMGRDEFVASGASPFMDKINDWVHKRNPGARIIYFSGEYESELQITDAGPEREAYIRENNRRGSVIHDIVTSGYHCLNLIKYFTCGEKEVKAWTVRRGTSAPSAAGVIHTDFEKNFICAEVISYADMKSLGSEAAVKKAGKKQTQGKNYIVEDGDIMVFKHGARK